MKTMQEGLVAAEAELAANGITTAVLAQFISWEGGLRGYEFAEQVFGAIQQVSDTLVTDLRGQLRLETHLLDLYADLPQRMQDWGLSYVVFNDHLPHDRLAKGQVPKRMVGQALKAGRNPDDHLRMMQDLHAQSADVPGALDWLCKVLASRGIQMGSHDDTTAEGRALWRKRGVRVAEFPETLEAAEAAAAAGCRMTHVGTSYEYGTEDGTLDETRRLAPTGIYGVTKAAATLALQDLARRTGAPIAIVRPFSMYGPLEGGHKFVPMVMEASREGRAVKLTPGHQERDYLYVGDVVEACLDLAVAQPFPAGAIFNVCSGRGLSLRDLAGAAVKAAGGDPTCLRWGEKPYRPAESMRVVGDPARIEEAIGWRAATPLAEGMEHTAAAGSL